MHALEKEMAAHSSVLAWRIPGTGGAWWAAIYGVAQNWTQLKRLSSSSSSSSSSNDCVNVKTEEEECCKDSHITTWVANWLVG